MTVREYISQKFKAFGITEAQLLDMSISGGFSFDDEYNSENASVVGKAMASAVEEIVLMPKVSNVTESGFSVSWDFDGIGKYYLWLCKKWGGTPKDDVLSMLGISMITDKTDCW